MIMLILIIIIVIIIIIIKPCILIERKREVSLTAI